MTTISPHRPSMVRLINAAGRGASCLGLDLPDLRPEALTATARKRTKLEDFGPDHFQPGLEHLLEAVERDAALHFEAYYERYGVRRNA
jgi:hypothetical protein